jgi:hypothetical protein
MFICAPVLGRECFARATSTDFSCFDIRKIIGEPKAIMIVWPSAGAASAMVLETSNFRCYFCGSRFAADWAAYQGRFLHAWKVAVCVHCLANNPNGISQDHPALQPLAAAGIPIEPDPDGIVPWPDQAEDRRRLKMELLARKEAPRPAVDDP